MNETLIREALDQMLLALAAVDADAAKASVHASVGVGLASMAVSGPTPGGGHRTDSVDRVLEAWKAELDVLGQATKPGHPVKVAPPGKG